jgi:glycosyltransferase involved in cell wall biosynthesis
LGGLSEADRDALVAGSRASLVPSAGPELFGLVVIEALACGTPVSPAAPVRSTRSCATGSSDSSGTTPHSSPSSMSDWTGWIGGDPGDALERFAVGPMADGYEALHARTLGD